MKHFILFTLLACSLSQSQVFAQNLVDTNCLQNLRIHLYNESKFIYNVINSGKCWHMKYSNSIEFLNENKYESTNSKGEIIAGKNLRISLSESVDMYADTDYMISIDKKSKKILRVKSDSVSFKLPQVDHISMLRDSLLNVMTLAKCSKEKINAKTTYRYTLKSNKLRCPYRIATIIIDSSTNSICNLDIEMNLAFQKEVKSFKMNIQEKNDIDCFSYTEGVSEKFIDKNGKLKPAYTSYTIDDLTKKQ